MARDLPWRRERTPYRVWISEIMLQQTRVGTVLPYYTAFLAAFPELGQLAAAPEDEVMARWAGLGYYSRARNLMACAREVQTRYGGEFPADPAALRGLPGFGPYTTAAVGSLAFGLPLAALDGNVIRVLCRLFALEDPPARPAVRSRLQVLADELLEFAAPGDWNEALMELGARVCLPRRPRCAECPLATECLARAQGRQEELPRRAERPRVPVRAVLVLLVRDTAGRVLARRRGDEGMLRGLWELPGAERPVDPAGLDEAWSALEAELRAALVGNPSARETGTLHFRHVYSHFQAQVLARRLELPGQAEAPAGSVWLEAADCVRLGFSARDRRILDEPCWEVT